MAAMHDTKAAHRSSFLFGLPTLADNALGRTARRLEAPVLISANALSCWTPDVIPRVATEQKVCSGPPQPPAVPVALRNRLENTEAPRDGGSADARVFDGGGAFGGGHGHR